MFNHRQATGHKLTAALRQQSAWSSQGTPVRGGARVCACVCVKVQDKQKKREREKTGRWSELKAGLFSITYQII